MKNRNDFYTWKTKSHYIMTSLILVWDVSVARHQTILLTNAIQYTSSLTENEYLKKSYFQPKAKELKITSKGSEGILVRCNHYN